LQPGSITFIQRFGSALNLHLHFHILFLEGVYLDRTEASLKPRFLTVEPPSDADVANVIQKISHRVIRKLRQLGYLERIRISFLRIPPSARLYRGRRGGERV